MLRFPMSNTFTNWLLCKSARAGVAPRPEKVALTTGVVLQTVEGPALLSALRP